jgi:hypothetical protein
MRRFLTFAILLMICAFRANALDHFVSLTSPNPAPPYTNWDTAAHVIQDAIDAANAGDTVLVTNGLYNTGGRVVQGTLTNRIAITKSLTVQSVNGPDVTVIEGHQVPAITNGPGAIRCVYMTNNTTLIGFTITHGGTETNLDLPYDVSAGGVLCANMTNCVLSNCGITSNSAYVDGGVLGGTLNNCVIANNSAFWAGGSENSILNRCLITNNYSIIGAGGLRGNSGPGVLLNGYPAASANYCIIAGNSSGAGHGGADMSILNNCLIIGNQGEGVYSCRVFNCTVVSNSIGIKFSVVLNSINYYNDTNYPYQEAYFIHSCTTPLDPYGFGNIADAPLFTDPTHRDFRLQPNSPCINAADNRFLTITNNEFDTNTFIFTIVTKDFDGNPRIVGGTVDMGAYEFQSPASQISYAWLQQHGYPPDGSADSADPDGDRMNNYQEWRARTDPANNTSLLKMFVPTLTLSGPTLTWQSQTNVNYFLQRAVNPGAPFATIQSNIVGQSGTTSFNDTNSAGNNSFFYRVGVQ